MAGTRLRRAQGRRQTRHSSRRSSVSEPIVAAAPVFTTELFLSELFVIAASVFTTELFFAELFVIDAAKREQRGPYEVPALDDGRACRALSHEGVGWGAMGRHGPTLYGMRVTGD